MYQHNIFIGNSYELGERIALHFVVQNSTNQNDQKNLQKLAEFTKNLYDKLGRSEGITMHAISTEDSSWESVVKKDSYFDDIRLIKNIGEFVDILKKNESISEADVKMLIYFLLSKNATIFTDRESTFKKIVMSYNETHHGPLYQESGKEISMPTDEDLNKMSNVLIDRVISSSNGVEKFKFILEKLHDITKSPLFL